MSEIVAPIITDSTGQAIATAISGAVSKADKSDIAPEFSTSADYAKGSMVYYQGTLYEFTAAHNHVAWTGSDVIAVKVSSEINTLKSGLTNKVDYLYYNKESSASEDDAIRDLYDSIDIYDKTVVGTLNYHGFWMFVALKYTGGSYGSIVLFRFDQTAKFLNVYEGVKTIRSFTLGS